MTEPIYKAVKANTPKPGDRGYKRSWKNLLINKRYQLQFTLFMVGLAAVLMVLLGYRVVSKANEATTVSKVGILGETCPEIPVVSAPVAAVPTPVDVPPVVDNGSAAGSGSSAGSGSGSGSGSAAIDLMGPVAAVWCLDDTDTACPSPPIAGQPLVVSAAKDCDGTVDYKLGSADNLDPLHAAKIATIEFKDGKKHEVPSKARRAKPKIDESTLDVTMAPPTPVPVVPAFKMPDNFSDSVAQHWKCELEHTGKLADLDRGKIMIFLVLIASGLMLLVGLGVYGIKMTHKVAGPLFKVSLYLGKMRDGRLDKGYHLRKGDQLVEFYDHFKTAHAGVVDMEKADIAKLVQVIAAAEAAGAGDHAAVAELRAILARKEKTIE